jgi:hypothetical protein
MRRQMQKRRTTYFELKLDGFRAIAVVENGRDCPSLEQASNFPVTNSPINVHTRKKADYEQRQLWIGELCE